MARPRKKIDEVVLLKLRESGKTQEEISKELGISIPTVTRRLTALNSEGLLTKYRQLQGLQLTELQAQILESVDSKNFKDASLIELLNAFHVLKKAEIAIQGKESFKGWNLLGHLQVLEPF